MSHHDANAAFIGWLCSAMNSMQEGQCIDVPVRSMQEAFPVMPYGMGQTTEDRFLSSLMGAANGCWRIRRSDIGFERFVISKHPPSDKTWYVDPDRRQYYDQQPDGSWVRNKLQYVRPY